MQQADFGPAPTRPTRAARSTSSSRRRSATLTRRPGSPAIVKYRLARRGGQPAARAARTSRTTTSSAPTTRPPARRFPPGRGHRRLPVPLLLGRSPRSTRRRRPTRSLAGTGPRAAARLRRHDRPRRAGLPEGDRRLAVRAGRAQRRRADGRHHPRGLPLRVEARRRAECQSEWPGFRHDPQHSGNYDATARRRGPRRRFASSAAAWPSGRRATTASAGR